jgi:FdhD protein
VDPTRAGDAVSVGVTPRRIRRFTDQGSRWIDAVIVIEEPLEIRIEGQPVAVLMRTPGMEKELAAGFVLGEGLVAAPSEIALIRHCGRTVAEEDAERDPLDESRNLVDVRLLPGATQALNKDQQQFSVQLIQSGCGRTDATMLAQNLPTVESEIQIPLAVLERLPGQMTRQQAAYRAAGGVHGAAVFDHKGRRIVVCEDIGRHNAVDKALGYCLLHGIGLRDKLLVSTGRASSDMVAKGVRLGLPIIASISSPTSLAIELAESLNCTLLGYLRGKSLNVYTHGWRITQTQHH